MISPRWPEGILFGHAERSYRKTVLSGVDALTLTRVAVVPRHPLGWVFFQLLQMALQLGEIVEGVGAAEFGSVDQAHEHVSDPVHRFQSDKTSCFSDEEWPSSKLFRRCCYQQGRRPGAETR